ncbi:hypothetical protein SRHO_G00333230 [Serrasalmus rhombeus]
MKRKEQSKWDFLTPVAVTRGRCVQRDRPSPGTTAERTETDGPVYSPRAFSAHSASSRDPSVSDRRGHEAYHGDHVPSVTSVRPRSCFNDAGMFSAALPMRAADWSVLAAIYKTRVWFEAPVS